MNKYQTITRHLVSDNTEAFNKNLYKVPFFNIYFLKAIKTENNLKFKLGKMNLIGKKMIGKINKKKLKDSKKLSKVQREILEKYIKKNSFWATGSASIIEIENPLYSFWPDSKSTHSKTNRW